MDRTFFYKILARGLVFQMKVSKVWEILKRFKELCKFYGWRTAESEDWIETDNKYHSFLLARNVHPSSFKTIIANRKCVVREGLSYRVVEASYIAWLFSETPSQSLVNVFREKPEFSKNVALYDLSPLMEGKNACFRWNQTDSPVLKEFERFLESEFGVKVAEHADLKVGLEKALAEVS
ncbi:MAG: hypothetical protein QW493_03260 [Candidatus Bathyarchaeia archaeon]